MKLGSEGIDGRFGINDGKDGMDGMLDWIIDIRGMLGMCCEIEGSMLLDSRSEMVRVEFFKNSEFRVGREGNPHADEQSTSASGPLWPF